MTEAEMDDLVRRDALFSAHVRKQKAAFRDMIQKLQDSLNSVRYEEYLFEQSITGDGWNKEREIWLAEQKED